MLSRVVRIPIRFTYSAALKPEISNVPQVTKQSKNQIKQINRLREETVLAHLQQYSINFQTEVDGKTLVLRSAPEIRNGYNIHDISAALLSIGTAYGLISSFNYITILALGVGAAANLFTSLRKNSVRGENIITAIHADNDKRLHLTYLTPSGYETLIVDKKDFSYNILNSGSSGTSAIWCKAQNNSFWISKKNLEINNHQLHNLL